MVVRPHAKPILAEKLRLTADTRHLHPPVRYGGLKSKEGASFVQTNEFLTRGRPAYLCCLTTWFNIGFVGLKFDKNPRNYHGLLVPDLSPPMNPHTRTDKSLRPREVESHLLEQELPVKLLARDERDTIIGFDVHVWMCR